MKSLIAFACLLAVASAGYLHSPVVGPAVAYAAYGDGAYRGEGLYESQYKGEGLIESQDLARVAIAAPVAYAAHTYAAAAPVVAAAPIVARASHAVAYNAPLVSAPHPVAVAHTYAAPYAYAAPVVAKASHAVAYNAPLVSAPHPIPVAHTYAGPYAYAAPIAHAYAAHAYAAPAVALASEARLVDPVAIAAGAPLPTGDTVEVAAAKAAHFQAHAAAKGLAYGVHHAVAAPAVALASEARLVDPVAIAAGAPLPSGDTVEVAAAKAAHYVAHHNAKTNHLLAKGHIIAKRGLLATSYAAPIAHSYGYSTLAHPIAYSNYGYGRLYL